jgi:integrase/recombinase XerD
MTRFFCGFPDLAGRVAPSTIRQYQYDLQRYLEFCQWNKDRALTPASLRAWRTHMVDVEQLAAATINRRLAAVKSTLRLCVTHDGLEIAQAYGFSLVEKVRPSTLKHRMREDVRVRIQPDDMRRLWRIPNPATLKGARDRALMATLAASGCRISEAIALKRSEIFWAHDRGTIEVLGKNQVYSRRAPLTREAYEWICRWLERRLSFGIDVELVFTRVTGAGRVPTGSPLSRQGAYKIIKQAARAAGLPNVKPHDFRRFVGSELAKRHQLIVVQRTLGHQQIETTTKYVLDHPDMEQMTEGLW